MPQSPADISFIFFGTSEFSVYILERLFEAGFVPKLIITTPDAKSGRRMLLTPPPSKVWADTHTIPVFQPASLKNKSIPTEILTHAGVEKIDLGIVVSYGLIITQAVLDIPDHGILNVHPSLLPKLRGASPIESTILFDEKPGVSIMKIDAQMDHGPIVAQEEVSPSVNPTYRNELYELLRDTVATLLINSIIPWIQGDIKAREQNHTDATFCEKFTKADMRIDLRDDPQQNLRKIRAFAGTSHAYFMDTDKQGKDIRVKVTQADVQANQLILKRVIPEGKKEMSYDEYATNIKSTS